MADSLFIMPQIPPLAAGKTRPAATAGAPSSGTSFETVLGAQLQSPGVQFSKHASSRMHSRGIRMDAGELGRLNQAVQLASAKGSRDSLVLLDNKALVVSVTDNTVVTIADREQLRGNVFTNIDSAIIA